MTEKPLDIQRLERYSSLQSEYTLAIITDEDHASQVELEDGQTAWKSTLRFDKLYREIDPDTGKAFYRLEEMPKDQGGEHHLISLIAEGGRGAEFSELVQFGNRLLTFDDRTGLVCEIRNKNQLVPRHILMTGSGDEKFKGFKSEWATLKDNQMIVGSHGKNAEEAWIKVLSRNYGLESINWHNNYQRIKDALNVGDQGYVTHEAAEWHPYRNCWLFFPRKISRSPFEEAIDEKECGGNTLIIANCSGSMIPDTNVGGKIATISEVSDDQKTTFLYS